MENEAIVKLKKVKIEWRVKMKSEDVIIEFNQEIIDAYAIWYKKKYARRKNIFNRAMLPSWNFLIDMTFQKRNNYKQKLQELFVFMINHLGLQDYGISSCDLEVEVTFPTLTKHDLDNLSLKSCLSMGSQNPG